jgi:hypothetical protein
MIESFGDRASENADLARRQPAETTGATLCCRIRDTRGFRIEGNLQIEVLHRGSGQTWRTFRYRARSGQHIFRGLPLGDYAVRVEAAGFRAIAIDTSLTNRKRDLDICLDAANGERLILNVAGLKGPFTSHAQQLVRDPIARAAVVEDETGRFSLTTRLTLALLEDSRVAASLVPTLRRGTMAPMAEWMSAQIRASWKFCVSATAAENIVSSLVEARLQLFVLSRAVFGNRLVRYLASDISDEEVCSHTCRFLAALDSPELDGIHPILVELFEPRRACIEKFLRTVQADFGPRPERGSAVPVTPANGYSASIVTTFERWADDAAVPCRLGHDLSALRIWPIADALATALGHPTWRT